MEIFIGIVIVVLVGLFIWYSNSKMTDDAGQNESVKDDLDSDDENQIVESSDKDKSASGGINDVVVTLLNIFSLLNFLGAVVVVIGIVFGAISYSLLTLVVIVFSALCSAVFFKAIAIVVEAASIYIEKNRK